jgi:hypothetical protein
LQPPTQNEPAKGIHSAHISADGGKYGVNGRRRRPRREAVRMRLPIALRRRCLPSAVSQYDSNKRPAVVPWVSRPLQMGSRRAVRLGALCNSHDVARPFSNCRSVPDDSSNPSRLRGKGTRAAEPPRDSAHAVGGSAIDACWRGVQLLQAPLLNWNSREHALFDQITLTTSPVARSKQHRGRARGDTSH